MSTYLSPGVYVEEMEGGSRPIQGVGTAVAAFVGLAERGPFNTATLVSNWTQFTSTFGGFVENTYLAHAVYGYFMNGGGNCYIVRIGDEGDNGAGGSETGRQQPAQAPPQGMIGRRLRAVAQNAAARPGEIEIEVVPPGGESPSDDMFKLLVKQGGEVVEEYDRATVTRGKQNVTTMVNAASKVIKIEDIGSGVNEKPEPGTVVGLTAPAPAAAVPSSTLTTDDYVGDVAERTGFGGLEAVDEITMVCVPDLMSAYQQGAVDLETVQAVQLGMIAHCELMGDRVAILDPPPGFNAQQIKEWRVDKARYDSKYAALYWPWVKVFRPCHRPPAVRPAERSCGRDLGTQRRHPWGAQGARERGRPRGHRARDPDHPERARPAQPGRDQLHPGLLRRGIRVYGARTLSSDPAWRYLNVRRLFNYLEESILNGTQWVVFEPNDDALWARIRRTISAFLVNEWRAGACSD